MASGQSVMLVSSVVSAVSLSACLTVCLSLSLLVHVLKVTQLLLDEYLHILNTTKVQ